MSVKSHILLTRNATKAALPRELVKFFVLQHDIPSSVSFLAPSADMAADTGCPDPMRRLYSHIYTYTVKEAER